MYVSLWTAAVQMWQRGGSMLENQNQWAASEFTYVLLLFSI